MAAMERDYFYPPLADRDSPAVWNEKGGPDIRTVAREKARAILDNHRPNYIAGDLDRQLRDRFDILLDV